MPERERREDLSTEPNLELVNPAALSSDQRLEYMDRYYAAMRGEDGELKTYVGKDALIELDLGIGARIKVEGGQALFGSHGDSDGSHVYVLVHDGKWRNWSSRHPETDIQGVDRLEIDGISFTLDTHLLLPGKLDS